MLNYLDTQITRNDVCLPIWDVSILHDNLSTNLPQSHAAILSYFLTKTQGQRMAMRSDLSPADLVPFLPNMWLVDVDWDENDEIKDMRIRLIGTALANFYGEYTGYSLVNFDEETVISKCLTHSLTRARKLVLSQAKSRFPTFTIAKEDSMGKPVLDLSTLTIPFSNDGERINMIFGYSECKLGMNLLQ